MIERVVNRRPDWTTFIGSTMVVVGLGFFVVVFVALFPVLTDPAGAYDRWFPVGDEVVDEAAELEAAGSDGPTAAFRWEALVVESTERTVHQVRLTAAASPEPAVAWRWDFGDGTAGIGEALIHEYPSPGSYVVTLTVEDSSGRVDTLGGTVIVPQLDGSAGIVGRVDELLAPGDDFQAFGDGINSTLQDAVGSVGEDINTTLDSALGSIGSTVRGGVVVALFALASLAATVVAWRTARIGVMLLTSASRVDVGDGPSRPRFADDEDSGRELEIVR